MKRLFSGLAVAFVLVARAHGECLDTGIRELVQVRGESCSSARAVLQERVKPSGIAARGSSRVSSPRMSVGIPPGWWTTS